MTIKKHIPNLITLANLFCGTIACIFAIKQNFQITALLVTIGILFDFFDGFIARLLNVQGDLGKQLDSLADMVTSGLVPGIVMFQLFIKSINKYAVGYFELDFQSSIQSYLPYLGLLLTVSAAYRLAKFNIDHRQSDFFIGLPTPAMSLFVISLPLIFSFSLYFSELIINKYFLIITTLLLSVLMNIQMPLFSLKFKTFNLKDNLIRYLFLLFSIILLIFLHFTAIPLIIVLYVLVSLLNNTTIFNLFRIRFKVGNK